MARRAGYGAVGRKRGGGPSWLSIVALVIALAGLGATLYLQALREREPEIVAQVEPRHVDPITDLPVAPDRVPPPLVELPPPEEPPALPQPPLDESDDEVLGWLNELFGADTVARFFVPERLIRNIVVTIDNLPRERVALQQRPVRPTPRRFLTEGPEESLVMSPQNYARYAPFMELVRGTDAQTVVALYQRYRSLFQEAYEDLGYPNGSFDARLIEVIEHLLGASELRDPVALVQPGVMYQYSDPQLERQSAGRKLIMRLGPANAAIVKAKLREIRAELERY
jgi:hypothetical protein